ncbi:MAG: class I SAM-dependent methyltransferase [Hamadaea sp.]|uniref:class I SAM-dependent methyltransferase n=1 Tax=Hamadaea sp. TaxID=2024425 RepID=UPI0017EA3AC8|nr:class I SAM-dependent methyltransferase [Hamadaea sp.]NUT22475.1 class I SAM-dependent methyltransferase [Hamadaea sp.]
MTSTRSSYDAVADRYAAEIGDELAGKPWDRALLSAFAEQTSGGPVLDVGCGPGHVTAYLAGWGLDVVGLDLSTGMTSVARRSTALPFVTADMTALPIQSSAIAGLVCLYAVIHLDPAARATAYAEFARVLRPGGQALIAFHVEDAETPMGGRQTLTEWWDHPVELTFHYPDPAAESAALAAAGLELVGRFDRAPHPDAEHASRRSYLIARRP